MKENLEKLLVGLLAGARSFGSLLQVVRNRRTLASCLKEGVGMGLVRAVEAGYELTDRGRKVAEKLAEIKEIMGAPVPDLDRIPHPLYRDLMRRYFELLIERLGDRLRSLVLFGSVARGDWRKDSDIDLLVIAEGSEDPIRALDELVEVELELRKAPEYSRALAEGFYPKIQHYPLSPPDLGKMPRILLDAVADGIVIYDRGEFRETAERLRARLMESNSYRVELMNGRWFWVLGAEEI
ncbi:MAG: nucleotidyltransferase domain-containing protein [Candidatus Hadarchaeales archaeon]